MTAMHETPDDKNLHGGGEDVDDTGESLDIADAPAAEDAPSQTAKTGPAGRSANMGHT